MYCARKLIDRKTVRIFAYSSTREQSNEAENRQRDWGETLPTDGRVRTNPFATTLNSEAKLLETRLFDNVVKSEQVSLLRKTKGEP